MKAYRLLSNKELDIVNDTWLYDVDEDFTSKKGYILRAISLTAKINREYCTNYSWVELFGEPSDIGYCYCPKCGTFHWADEDCECDDYYE